MTDSNLRNQVISGLRWTIITRLIMQLMMWASTIIVIRILLPTDYGLVVMSTFLFNYLMMLGEMGLTAALIQRPEISLETKQSVFGFLLVACGVLFIISISCAPLVASYFSEKKIIPMIIISSIQFLVLAFSVIPQAHLSKEMRFKDLGLAGMVTTTLSTFVTLILAYLGAGAYALIIGAVTSSMMRTVAINYMSPFFYRPSLKFKLLKDLAAFSSFIVLERTIWYWYSQFDYLLVGSIFGAEKLGIYTIAKQLVSIPLERFAEIMNMIAMPAYSSCQHDKHRVQESVLKTLRMTAIIVFPAFWGFGLTAEEIVELLLSSKWHDTAPLISILCLIMPLRVLVTLFPPLVIALGKPQVTIKVMLITASFIIPSILIGSRWQLIGMAYAWAITYPIAYLITIQLVGQCVGLTVQNMLIPLYKPFIASVIMVFAVLIASNIPIVWHYTLIKLIFLISIGSIIYILTFWLIARSLAYEFILFAKDFFSKNRSAA